MNRHLSALFIPALVGLGLCAGFVREVFLAYLFGTSREIEIFRVAFGIPSILSEALAVSFVSVLIPVFFSEQRTLSLQRAVWAAGAVACLVFLIGVITMPLQAQILAPGITDGNRAQLVAAGRICWAMFLIAILSLPLRAYMSVENRLWPGASAALFRSGGFIVLLSAMVLLETGLPSAVTAAWSAVGAAAIVFAVHVAALGSERRARYWLALRSWSVPTEMAALVYSLLLVLGTQLLISGGRIIDRAVASNMGEGTLAAVEYSYALTMAAAAVIGTSANIILAPRIGQAIRLRGKIPLRYWKIIAAVTALATITGIALSMLASPLIALVFQNGEFGPDDTALTARVIRLHSIALGPLVLALLLTQVLILSGGQRWLVPTAAFKLVVKIVSLWALLKAGLGLEGIAMSLSFTELGVVVGLGLALMMRERKGTSSPDRS